MKDHRVIAIRECPVVGEGSLTSIDECWQDDELIKHMNEDNIHSKRAAKNWAISMESLWIGRCLDCRLGDDDDPELKLWSNFKKKVAKHYPHISL